MRIIGTLNDIGGYARVIKCYISKLNMVVLFYCRLIRLGCCSVRYKRFALDHFEVHGMNHH